MRIIKEFSASGKPLIVGLPGMGRVGYVSANFFIEKFNGEHIADVYSTYFPPQLIVGKAGLSNLFVGKLFDVGNALVFTAETQPPNPEGQNEVCYTLLDFLSERGVSAVLAGAAYVVPQVGDSRRVFIAGTDKELLATLMKLGAEPLNEGVISGINGAIVGWARYYGIPAAVVLGETWAPIVEFDEVDYRAAKRVIEVIASYLGLSVDTGYMIELADSVERKILKAISQAMKIGSGPEKRPSKEVM
ncbi:MAG: PAC2 family protein [Desulfurococcales archaeon]|nr:PAC2 family protein [Desulfurococcales archaeon]